MEKDDDKKKVYNQQAWILNYQPVIWEQHIHTEPKTTEKEADKGEDAAHDSPRAGQCFRFPNDFMRQKVEAVVTEFYRGAHAELALIEVALYDHGQLKKRNAHTAFVKALTEWGILNLADGNVMSQIVKGITDKYRHLPSEGYREWGNELLNDKHTCAAIGEKLGPTMKYSR